LLRKLTTTGSYERK